MFNFHPHTHFNLQVNNGTCVECLIICNNLSIAVQHFYEICSCCLCGMATEADGPPILYQIKPLTHQILVKGSDGWSEFWILRKFLADLLVAVIVM